MPEKTHNLEAAENWDLDNVEPVRRTKPIRAVVSVAFKREDFEVVAEHAEQKGMRTSEFIRKAALEKAVRSPAPATVNSFGGTTGTFVVAVAYPMTYVHNKILVAEYTRSYPANPKGTSRPQPSEHV